MGEQNRVAKELVKIYIREYNNFESGIGGYFLPEKIFFNEVQNQIQDFSDEDKKKIFKYFCIDALNIANKKMLIIYVTDYFLLMLFL